MFVINKPDFLKETGRILHFLPRISDHNLQRINYPVRVQKPTIVSNKGNYVYQTEMLVPFIPAGGKGDGELLPFYRKGDEWLSPLDLPDTRAAREKKLGEWKKDGFVPAQLRINNIRDYKILELQLADVELAGYGNNVREFVADFTRVNLPDFIAILDATYKTDDARWLSFWKGGLSREAVIRSRAWVFELELVNEL